MATLSANAARQINDWLVENKAWFTPEAVAARATLPPESSADVAAAGAGTAKPAPKPAPKPVPAN
jgi:hypothetical protein